MSPQLRKTIQNFLVNGDKQLDDLNKSIKSDEKYCCLFLEKSLDLLRKCISEDYKIPTDEK